jgi:cytochrome c-type biogenesis protein CcmF
MVGFIGLVVTSLVVEVSILMYVTGLVRKESRFTRYADYGTIASAVLMSLVTLYLLSLLLANDFQTIYVAQHTSKNLPLVYTVSALWAGQEGSLLLWGWLTSICTVVVVLKSSRSDKFKPYVASILNLVLLFFLLTLLFASNPFARYSFVPADGAGLNPLLQDLGMVIHPPTLFIGYTLIAVPFGYAMAGLITKDEEWLTRIRGWTLASWLFLSLGIALGGWWSYHVLGWGGYWAWDPVENASLMPWLIMTAFLHSVMIQEGKRGMKLWNMLLITFSFLLVIYATFLTRSGIIQSVHSFAGSPGGIYFGTFLGITALSSFALIITRYRWLKSRNVFEAYFSRESAFLFNNLIFTVLTLLILLGTSFPILSEALRGYQVRVGPGYFNETVSPLSLILMILMGICPLIAWRQATLADLIRNIRFPVAGSVLVTVIAYFFGNNAFGGVVISLMAGFVTASIIQEFYQTMEPSTPHPLTERIGLLTSSVSRNRRRYGGYLIHLSMVLLVVGVAGSSLFETTKMVSLSEGGDFSMAEYSFTLLDVSQTNDIDVSRTTARMEIYRNGRMIHEASPSIASFTRQESTVRYPHIHQAGLTDLYIIYESLQSGQATFTIKIIPLVSLIWIGTVVGLVGGVVAAWPRKVRAEGG